MKKSLFFLFALALFTPCARAETTPDLPTKKTLWKQILEGGWVMIPIGACSMLTVWLIGDNTLRTSRSRIAPETDSHSLRHLFRQGDYMNAYRHCRANPSPLTNVVLAGITALGEGRAIVENELIAQLTRENNRFQTRISYLSVIGVCTPMIGLLGTTTGMIEAFATLGSHGIGDPSKLASAIGEVLVATASGLFIAIPAFGAFYYLRNRTANSLHRVEQIVSSLFRRLPHELFEGVLITDEEIYAAKPNWTTEE